MGKLKEFEWFKDELKYTIDHEDEENKTHVPHRLHKCIPHIHKLYKTTMHVQEKGWSNK